MAQHGYLREYDDGWDRGDDRDREHSWRDEDRERGWRGGSDEWSHRDRGWRDEDRDSSGRNRNFMFGDRNQSGDWDRDRGSFGRMGDNARSWFRDEDRQYRGSHQDDHYRSWRDRQMSALDRDYEDYCREREQQFHQDFDGWRRNRQNRGSGTQQQGQQSGNNGEVAVAAEDELTLTRAMAGQGNTPSPEGAATLGTNNSENSGIGRGKRQS